MFSWSRKPPRKIKEKLDFKFQFHSTQVPSKSWDRLAVSIISLDSGRVIGKTAKATTRNGHCHWPDAITDTVKLVLDTRSLEYGEKLLKFVVAKGLARSSALGEAIINIAEFVSASSPVTLILPLRLCYTGTILHITIQCLTPKCIDKALSQEPEIKLLKDGYASDSERELNDGAAARTSSVHRLLRTYSVGSQRPASTNSPVECCDIQSTPPRKSDVGCKVYSNPCAFAADDNFSSAIYTTKPAEKKPDETNDGADEEKFRLLVSSFTEDLSNMEPVLRDLSKQSQLDYGSQLVEDLQSVAHTTQALANQLRNRSEIKLEAGREAAFHMEISCEKEMTKLEEPKIIQLETQELERMQDINKQLEERIATLKLENQQLEVETQEQELKLQKRELECKSLRQKVVALEAEMKVLDEEKEAAVLENYVGENLAKDLFNQVREFLYKTKPVQAMLVSSACHSQDQSPGFIEQVKKLRTLFPELLDRVRELEKKHNDLEDRLLNAMADISFINEQFGQLSRESDKMIGLCDEELRKLQNRLEHELRETQHQSFLQLAFEENACEILYLRNEVRKLEEQVENTRKTASQPELQGGSRSSGASSLNVSSGRQSVNDEVGGLEVETLKSEVSSLIASTSLKLELEEDCANLARQLTDVEQDFQRAVKLIIDALRRSESHDYDKLKAEFGIALNRLKLEKTLLEKMVEKSHYELAVSKRTVSQLQAELELCKSKKSKEGVVTTEGSPKHICYYSEARVGEESSVEKDAEDDPLVEEREKLKAELCDWTAQRTELTARVRAFEVEAERLLKMVSSKEAEASQKQLELETIKQELKQKETFMWERIEFLERKLACQQADSDLEQLKNELIRLQKLNSELIMREHELSTKVSTFELLQLELQRLHEVGKNGKCCCRLCSLMVYQENDQLKQSQWPGIVEREAELSNALEANNLNKSELQSDISNQQENPYAGNLDGILGDLVSFKQRASFLEAELTEMQARYCKVSMRFAELQLEREELVMTVKSLTSPR